jgi:hypothetical protein
MKIKYLPLAAVLLLSSWDVLRADDANSTDRVAAPNSAAAGEQAADKVEMDQRAHTDAKEKREDRKSGGGEVVNSGDDVEEKGAYKDDLKGAKVAGDTGQESKDRQGISDEKKDIAEDKKVARQHRKNVAKAKAAKAKAKSVKASSAVSATRTADPALGSK